MNVRKARQLPCRAEQRWGSPGQDLCLVTTTGLGRDTLRATPELTFKTRYNIPQTQRGRWWLRLYMVQLLHKSNLMPHGYWAKHLLCLSDWIPIENAPDSSLSLDIQPNKTGRQTAGYFNRQTVGQALCSPFSFSASGESYQPGPG